VILVLGSLSLRQKSTLCFQTEDRVRIFPRSGNVPWQRCQKIGEVPVKARRFIQKAAAGKNGGSRLFADFRANRDFRGRQTGFGRAV
jgi:hypothetical protein